MKCNVQKYLTSPNKVTVERAKLDEFIDSKLDNWCSYFDLITLATLKNCFDFSDEQLVEYIHKFEETESQYKTKYEGQEKGDSLYALKCHISNGNPEIEKFLQNYKYTNISLDE